MIEQLLVVSREETCLWVPVINTVPKIGYASKKAEALYLTKLLLLRKSIHQKVSTQA